MVLRRDLSSRVGGARQAVLVGAGGLVGAPLRYVIGQALPSGAGGFPVATFLVNVTGAFALGLLLELLTSVGPETPRRQAARLALGTGLLGAFTTYSSVAVEVALLVRRGSAMLALSYGVGSAVAGLAAAAAGVGVGVGVAATLRRTAP